MEGMATSVAATGGWSKFRIHKTGRSLWPLLRVLTFLLLALSVAAGASAVPSTGLRALRGGSEVFAFAIPHACCR